MELNPIQEKFLLAFSKSPLARNFYWTGGTLLAVRYLKHRLSLDLDFFTMGVLNREAITRLVSSFAKQNRIDKVEQHRIHDRLEFFLKDGIEIRLDFASYNYKPLRKRSRWRGVPIDSLDDIAANKAVALMDRNDPKDVFDLCLLIIKKGYTVKKILKLARKKFSLVFSPATFLARAQLVAADISALSPLIPKRNGNRKIIQKVKEIIKKESDRYLSRVLDD